MKRKLTNADVAKLAVPPKDNRIYYDSDVKGFGVRVTANGHRAFVVNYRINGRERRYTIGDCGAWKVAAARERAGELRRMVDTGIDPLAEREDARTAPTVEELCDDWLGRPSIQAKRTVGEDKRKIDKIIKPEFGRRRVVDVDKSEIEDLHHKLGRDRPYLANRTLALLATLFALGVERGWRAGNPCKGVKPFHEEARARYLSFDEVRLLLEALAASPYQQSANVVRLLLLTGARRGEVLKSTWDQFILDGDKPKWVKPSSHTKQKRMHQVPLSTPAVTLLTAMKAKRNEREPYLFPGPKTGEPIGDIKKFWTGIRKAAGLENVRLHDLRHTHASILVSAGLSLPIIAGLLGHSRVRTTERYSHLSDDPLREAAERVGAVVAANGGDKPAAMIEALDGE